MSIAQSYKISAAAKQHSRLRGAYRRFQRALRRIAVRQVTPDWHMASARGLVAFAVSPDVARQKCEAALRNQLLSGLRVVEGA